MLALRKSKGVDFRSAWILDCETDGLGPIGGRPEVFLCVIYHAQYGYFDFWGNDAIIACLKKILELGGGDVYAHFGGRFDFRLAYKWLLNNGARGSLIFSGATVLVADFEIEGKRLCLCDSYRILPSKLAKIGESLGYPKLDWNHETTREVIKTVSGALKLLEYCKRDVEILHRGLVRFQAAVEPLGIQPRRTLAATCTSVARYRLSRAPKVPQALEEIAMACVYGGRTEVHDYNPLIAGSAFDRHSSYPASAAQAMVPWDFDKSSCFLDLKRAGFVKAKVSVPEDCKIPILPAKFDNQPGRVFFATGIMDGTWTIEELRGAVERKCAKIISVDNVYYYHESSFLQDFAQWGWDKRKEAIVAGDEFETYLWKIWSNSFIGKLIEKTKKMRASFGPPKDNLFTHEIRIGGQSIYMTETNYMPPFRHACAGGTILARSRIALWDYLQGGRVWYMDTDSMHTNVNSLPTGPELGEWGREKIRNAKYLAPKFYSYETFNEKKKKWERVVKSKGMPTDYESFLALQRGESVKIHRVRGFREAMRTNKDIDYQATEVTKKLNANIFPKRFRNADGTTRPWTAREIREYAVPRKRNLAKPGSGIAE